MTAPTNGTLRKIMVAVLSAIIIFLVTQVIVNTSRITAVETQVASIKDALNINREEVKTNRAENNEAHKTINDKLDRILLEMAKH